MNIADIKFNLSAAACFWKPACPACGAHLCCGVPNDIELGRMEKETACVHAQWHRVECQQCDKESTLYGFTFAMKHDHFQQYQPDRITYCRTELTGALEMLAADGWHVSRWHYQQGRLAHMLLGDHVDIHRIVVPVQENGVVETGFKLLRAINRCAAEQLSVPIRQMEAV